MFVRIQNNSRETNNLLKSKYDLIKALTILCKEIIQIGMFLVSTTHLFLRPVTSKNSGGKYTFFFVSSEIISVSKYFVPKKRSKDLWRFNFCLINNTYIYFTNL